MRRIVTLIVFMVILAACGVQNQASPDQSVVPAIIVEKTATPLPSASPSATLLPTATPSATLSPTPTMLPTITPTPLPWGNVMISVENAGKMEQLASWGRGEVLRYELNQSGQILVLSTLGFYLYRAVDHASLAEIPDALQFLLSPNQNLAAVLLKDGRVKIVNIENGDIKFELWYEAKLPLNFCPKCSPAQLQQFSEYYHSNAPMRFSQDQSRFALGAKDGSIVMWDLMDGSQIVRLYHDSAGMDQEIIFTPDGKYLLSTGRQPIAYVRYASLSLWSIAEEKMVWYIKESGRLDERLFSPDGNLMGVLQGVGGLNESVVKLYQIKDGKFVGQINGQISDEPFSPDSKNFISYHENNVLVWKIQPEFILMRTLYPPVAVKLANISEDGLHLEINGGELSYLLTDYQTITQGAANLPEPKSTTTITDEVFSGLGHLNQISGMTVSKDQQLFVWGGNQHVWRWHPLEGMVDWLRFETEPMSKPAFSEGGGKVATCSKENLSIAVWGDSAITNFERCLQNGILAFLPDGAALAYGFNTQLLTIDPLDGHTIQGFYGSGYPITWLEYARDGRFLASGGEICTMTCQGDLRLWDIVNAKGVSLESDGSEWPVTDVEFSSDSRLMMGAKQYVWIWDTTTGKLQGRFSEKGKEIALSPDDQILAIADQEGLIHLMNMSNREEIVTWETNQRSIIEITFTQDGKSLLSLAADGSLKLWGIR
ncbi:MAG: hypothetical protein HGB14_03920 [Anaerolineaceae bacterium]|nr:hypothetical protein [Anaerolineaceae bacterium]